MKAAPNTTVSNHRLIAFTTPETYAVRLSPLIHLKGWTPLWCPTITTKPTTHTNSSLLHHLSLLNQFSAIAFTSRPGISAFSDTLSLLNSPPYNHHNEQALTVCALGNDSQLINNFSFTKKLCSKNDMVNILVPEVATPAGMVEALGLGFGRKVMCPVPSVVGLKEPVVVPNFIRDLGLNGWVVVRVDAYETRWLGEKCAAVVVGDGGCVVDAVVFTSTGEVEGMLKSLKEMGLDWEDVLKRNPGMVVAAHGPVTAAGAESLGVGVDVVGSKFGSFDGVVDALAHFWDHN